MASSSMANLLSVPLRAGRKRSGSFSEVRSIARSLSSERPGTPRPTEVESKGYCVDSGISGFKKPSSIGDSRFFGSMDSLHSTSASKLSNTSLSSQILKRSFSTNLKPASRVSLAVSHSTKKTLRDPQQLSRITDLSAEELSRMEDYSMFVPTSVTMSHFLDHQDGGGTEEKSYAFLRNEIPVRIANIMKELELLPDELLAQPACREVISQYGQSFRELLQFEKAQNNADTWAKFLDVITNIRMRHQDVVPRMADALHGMRDSGDLKVNSKDRRNQAIQYALDRLYMARISIHRLIAHHKSLYCPEERKINTRLQGTIESKCDPTRIAEEAYENAAFLCDQIYLDHPKLNIITTNTVDDGAAKDTVNFVYIPSHLYHMFFEVFKNSMRATMEYHEDAETIPEIDVHIVKGVEDITIKVSDRGGGLRRCEMGNVFLYLYTSVTERVKLSGGDMGGTTSSTTPMHGLGYGLPLSRLYARYFGGDITLSSVSGIGTDVHIYVKTLETDAREHLPTFNATAHARISDTRNQQDDWATK